MVEKRCNFDLIGSHVIWFIRFDLIHVRFLQEGLGFSCWRSRTHAANGTMEMKPDWFGQNISYLGNLRNWSVFVWKARGGRNHHKSKNLSPFLTGSGSPHLWRFQKYRSHSTVRNVWESVICNKCLVLVLQWRGHRYIGDETQHVRVMTEVQVIYQPPGRWWRLSIHES